MISSIIVVYVYLRWMWNVKIYSFLRGKELLTLWLMTSMLMVTNARKILFLLFQENSNHNGCLLCEWYLILFSMITKKSSTSNKQHISTSFNQHNHCHNTFIYVCIHLLKFIQWNPIYCLYNNDLIIHYIIIV